MSNRFVKQMDNYSNRPATSNLAKEQRIAVTFITKETAHVRQFANHIVLSVPLSIMPFLRIHTLCDEAHRHCSGRTGYRRKPCLPRGADQRWRSSAGALPENRIERRSPLAERISRHHSLPAAPSRQGELIATNPFIDPRKSQEGKMLKRKVDVAIIGTGTAGMGAYREARKHTDSIALIEGSHYGTTCARVGCMPSKLLIAAAEAAHGAKHAGVFGLNVPTVETDGAAVLERVKRERDRFVGFVVEDVDEFEDSHKVRGYARFLDAHRVQIDNGLEITADRIVIATGSRPFIPEVLEGAGNRLLVNDDIFELEQLPTSVLVVGAGVIGLELGQALSRLNVNVTMLSRNESIGGIADSEIRTIAADTFQSEFDLVLHAEVLAAKEILNGVQVTYRTSGGIVRTVVVDYVLAATGRIPNTDKLGVENTGIALDARGVPDS